jgi:hypothetical protein
MRLDQHVEHVERDIDGALRIERSAGHQFREVFPLDVFHRNVEIAIALANIEDLRDASALFAFGQLVLKNRAPALGCDCVDTVAIRAGIEQARNTRPIPPPASLRTI